MAPITGTTPVTIAACPTDDEEASLRPLVKGILVLQSEADTEIQKYPAGTKIVEAPFSTANNDDDPSNNDVSFTLYPHSDTEAWDFYNSSFSKYGPDGLCKKSDGTHAVRPRITTSPTFAAGQTKEHYIKNILDTRGDLITAQSALAEEQIKYDFAEETVEQMEKSVSWGEIALANGMILWTGHRIFGTEVPRLTTMYEQFRLRAGSNSRLLTEWDSRKEYFNQIRKRNNLCFADGATSPFDQLPPVSTPKIGAVQIAEGVFMTGALGAAAWHAWPKDMQAKIEFGSNAGDIVIGDTKENLAKKSLAELKDKALKLQTELGTTNDELTILKIKMKVLDDNRTKPDPMKKLMMEGVGVGSSLASLVVAFCPLAHSAQKRFQATSPRVKSLADAMRQLSETQRDLAKREVRGLRDNGKLVKCPKLTPVPKEVPVTVPEAVPDTMPFVSLDGISTGEWIGIGVGVVVIGALCFTGIGEGILAGLGVGGAATAGGGGGFSSLGAAAALLGIGTAATVTGDEAEEPTTPGA